MPTEMISMGAAALMGAVIRMQAQSQANFMAVAELGMKAQDQNNDHQNDAAKRVQGWGATVRRIVILIVISVSFGGLIYCAITKTPVSFMHEIPTKTHLFGLFTSGGQLETIIADGFVIPPYVSHILSAISGFLFGAGTAKVTQRS